MFLPEASVDILIEDGSTGYSAYKKKRRDTLHFLTSDVQMAREPLCTSKFKQQGKN